MVHGNDKKCEGGRAYSAWNKALFAPTHRADGHTGLPGRFWPDFDHLFVTLSVATTVSLYGTAYRRTFGLIGFGVFKKALSGRAYPAWNVRVGASFKIAYIYI